MATVPSTPRTNLITLMAPSAGPFLVGFRLFELDALAVYVDGVLTTDFTVDATFSNGYDDAAEFTLGASQPTSTVIQVDGDMTPARTADYINGPGLVALMNVELARLWASLSEVRRIAKTAVRGLDEQDPVEGIDSTVLQGLDDALDEAEVAAAAASASALAAASSASIAAENAALLGIWRGAWATATAYALGDRVSNAGSSYYATVAHTSAALFSTDLSALKWGILAEKGAAGAGTGDMLAANNGSDFVNKPATVANIGAQPVNANLTAESGLTGAADRVSYFTGVGAKALAVLTNFGRSLIAAADDAAARTALGLGALALGTQTVIDAAAGIPANDNDLTLPTSAAVKDYVDARSGRILLATRTASASATLDFTEFNNAVYSRYVFVLENIKPATDLAYLQMRFSTDGGATYDNGASAYDWAVQGWNSSNANIQTGAVSTFLGLTHNAGIGSAGVGNAATEFGVTGEVTLYHAPTASVRSRVITELSYDNGDGNVIIMNGTGRRNAAQDTDAVRFLMSSGNITSGTIRMYGIAA